MKKNRQLFIYIGLAIVLLLCLLDMPYGFYTLVRFLAMVAFAYLAFLQYKDGDNARMWVFVVLAVLFQPLFKITLGRTIWNIVDVVVAAYLLYLTVKSFKKMTHPIKVLSFQGLLSLILFTSVVLSCTTGRSAKSESPQGASIRRTYPSQVMDIDTTKAGLYIFYPHFERIDLVCETMPTPEKDSTVIFCCAAAFTGQLSEQFSHNNIIANYVSGGVRYDTGTGGRINGAFIYYDGKWEFIQGNYSSQLDSAAKYGGMGFGQEMMIHEGREIPHTRPGRDVHIYRALCSIGGRLCIADAKGMVRFDTFIQNLLDAGAREALYMDMGRGWNCSWYRMTVPGEGYYIHPRAHYYTTNWITFYYDND